MQLCLGTVITKSGFEFALKTVSEATSLF